MIAIKNARLRSLLRVVLPFGVIPLAVLLCSLLANGGNHLLFSLLVAVLALVLFLAGFERKTTGARRMVIVAVMTALCIAGRFIPFFKPITALTIITAMYLGSESGFLVGALAALLSNFSFGQGPWTPFQMLAWGMIGLWAGYLSVPLQRHRCLLLLYGTVSAALFSLVMDVWTVLWYNGSINWQLYAGAVAASLPHMALYGASNFLFLWFLARPFGAKLARIRRKYGL